MSATASVSVRDLRVELATSGADVLDDVSFDIAAGEVLGLVGESGSGKTTAGLALLGLARPGLRISGGTVHIRGESVLDASQDDLRSLRGKHVSYVPQDPGSALNPAMRVGHQLAEILDTHERDLTTAERHRRFEEVLAEVLLPADREFVRRYPHQLSGGQQQRVALAMAFACRPSAIVLDEPTTGLDVTTQAHVLRTVRDLCEAHGVAALYVSHDLAVVASIAQRVAVMYAGRLIEIGGVRDALTHPAHPYTRGLVDAIPRLTGEVGITGMLGSADRPGHRPRGCAFAPRCELATAECEAAPPPTFAVGADHEARCYRHGDVRMPATPRATAGPVVLRADASPPLLEVSSVSAAYGDKTVVFDVSLELGHRQCVAVVGESGSGKTTLARSIGGLHKAYTGAIRLRGEEIARGAEKRSAAQRRDIQYVFQSPYNSLSPRKTIDQILQQPLRLFSEADHTERYARIASVLEQVSLGTSVLHRYPRELSGGERQRIAIARALLCEPQVMVCDEVTSALDVSVQASIVTLLSRLQHETGIGILFVTHNLALIRELAQDVIVMSAGRVVESGNVETVLEEPREDYTKRLLADTPSLDAELAEDVGADY